MHPVLFEIGSVKLHSYGLFLAVGFLVGLYRAVKKSSFYGLSPSRVFDGGFVILFSGLVGARLTYAILNWGEYSAKPASLVHLWDGGMTYHGAVAGGLICMIIWARLAKINLAVALDLAAPSLVLSYAIARIGCFLNGCCYGCPTDLPWGVVFHSHGSTELTPPSHPVQLYSTIISIPIYFLLVLLERKRLSPGSLFGSWMIFSGIERYFMEYFRRGVTAEIVAGSLTQAQIVCLVMILLGALIFTYSTKRTSNG